MARKARARRRRLPSTPLSPFEKLRLKKEAVDQRQIALAQRFAVQGGRSIAERTEWESLEAESLRLDARIRAIEAKEMPKQNRAGVNERVGRRVELSERPLLFWRRAVEGDEEDFIEWPLALANLRRQKQDGILDWREIPSVTFETWKESLIPPWAQLLARVPQLKAGKPAKDRRGREKMRLHFHGKQLDDLQDPVAVVEQLADCAWRAFDRCARGNWKGVPSPVFDPKTRKIDFLVRGLRPAQLHDREARIAKTLELHAAVYHAVRLLCDWITGARQAMNLNKVLGRDRTEPPKLRRCGWCERFFVGRRLPRHEDVVCSRCEQKRRRSHDLQLGANSHKSPADRPL